MGLPRLIEIFTERSRRCEARNELFGLVDSAARELGFSKLALVHGLSFRRPDRNLIRMDNFGEWADIFVGRRYYQDDPALLACQRANTATSFLLPNGRTVSFAKHSGMGCETATRCRLAWWVNLRAAAPLLPMVRSCCAPNIIAPPRCSALKPSPKPAGFTVSLPGHPPCRGSAGANSNACAIS